MFGPVFHQEPQGLLANQMIEYMVALKFVEMVPGCRISNVSMPDWGIFRDPIDSSGPVAEERRQQYINLPELAERMRTGRIARVEWSGYGQRMEYFLPPEAYHNVFVPPFRDNVGYGPDYLVCHVRGRDVLDGSAPNYPATPPEFFRDIVTQTGLTPVFIGQTEPNGYTDRLRSFFPNARFRDTQDILVDFETIRQSRNVVVGVSTYAWLAAWLSRSAENIYMTVSGLFNPMQKFDVDLLPFGDRRFKFYLFPINYGLPLDRQVEVHRRIAPYWRRIPHETLRQQLAAAPRFEPDMDQIRTNFDEAFYLRENADVAAVARQAGPGFAWWHYAHHGFEERRLPFRVDPLWYASQYPLAGFEVAQGDYADFAHHYLAIGQERGYRPCPPEDQA